MPTIAEALSLALQHHQAGHLQESESIYRDILRAQPNHPEALHLLGVIAHQVGKHDIAVEHITRAIALNPRAAEYHSNLGEALRALDRLNEAVACFRRALELKPDFPGAHSNLGNAFQALGDPRGAQACYRRALALEPDSHVVHNNLGNAHLALGDQREAEGCYRRALELNPAYPVAHNNLGNALREQGRFREAEACYRRAIELDSDFPEAHNNLGSALLALGDQCEAKVCFCRAVELKPDYPMAHNNLGNALLAKGDPFEAQACYRHALNIKAEASFHSNLLFCLSHDDRMGAQALFAEHCVFGRQFEVPLRPQWKRHANLRDPGRKVQVGFVSADLGAHAVASFIEPALLRLAGCPQLSLHAYSNQVAEDKVSQRLRAYFAHWCRVHSLSDEALAEKIRADQIDILIDLSGHTAFNRLLTFARKPAPVQASWIGYPGTTGLSAMDYYLADRFFLPRAQFEGQFTEKIVHLPVVVPFQPDKGAPAVNALPALSNGFVTFGSFNRQSKLSPSVIEHWSKLLRALPDSRMVLGGLPEDGRHEALAERFAREGIAPDRLSFHARCGMDAYLDLHRQVDFCLDTFAYTGGTTTFHALWMGVPTLTIAGETAPRRQGAAILGHVGLEAFIAKDAEDFVQKGLYWAGNLPALASLRAGLRERFAKSAIGQPAVVAAGLEQAFRIMWQRWCMGLPAEAFDVPRAIPIEPTA